MKKIVVLIMFLFFLILKSKAQYSEETPHYAPVDKYTVLDSAYLKCTYKLTYIKDTLHKTNISSDIQTLQIGSNISKYFSQYVLEFNKKYEQLKNEGGNKFPRSTEYGSCSYEVFKNYPKGKFTVTDFGINLIMSNIHEELIPELKWNIKMEFDTVLSYRCQKATTRFRGRNYEAWFTSDIPIGNGPWKLGGLPGLILKVSDQQHYYNFDCIGLEKLNKKEPIKFYQLDYRHIERKDLNKLYFRLNNEPVLFAKMLGKTLVIIDDDGREGTDAKFPYNPIEHE